MGLLDSEAGKRRLLTVEIPVIERYNEGRDAMYQIRMSRLGSTLLLAGNSVATALLAAGLAGGTMGEGAGDPTGLMLKSVLMAASWRRFAETNPNPVPPAILPRRLQCFVRERDESPAAKTARL